MDYKDSVLLLKRKNNFIRKYLLKRKLKKIYFDYVEGCLQDIDSMLKWIDKNERDIEEWEEIDKDKYKDHILQVEALNQFIEANCHLLFLECDIRLAVYHMTVSDHDWEYRFFVRRVYTLLYETEQTYSKVAGELITPCKGIIDPKTLKSYIEAKGRLDRFLKTHHDRFKCIRNSNEAHKSRKVKAQKTSIESIEAVDSWRLIQEAGMLFENLTMNITKVYNAFLLSSSNLLQQSLKD